MRALVALLLALQDADGLVGQLGDEEIEVRERAAQSLVEMGAKARPALEKAAKGGDAEVAGRARSILGEIALAENRRKVFGPVGKVTLGEGDHSLEQIAAAVKEQTEVALAMPKEMAAERVRIGARGDPLWPFLDRLCRAHGGLRLRQDQPEEAIGLEKGTSGASPLHYSGSFRVWIERLRLERRDPFEGGWNRGSFVMDIAWPPTVRPLGSWHSASVTVKEILGDDGKTLKVNPALGDLYPNASSWSGRVRTHREMVAFEYPAAGVKRLSRIRGTATFVFPQKIETLTFEKPLEGEAKKAAGEMTALIYAFKSGTEGVQGALRLLSPPERTDAPASAGRPKLNDRFRWDSVVLVDAGGREHRGEPGSSSSSSQFEPGGTKQESIDRVYLFGEARDAASIRFEVVTEHFQKVVEFEFKDVELP